MNRSFVNIILLVLIGISISGCHENYTPKPRGFFRISFPEKSYLTFINSFPYSFEYPVYAKIVPDTIGKAEPYWIDVVIPSNKAKIHLSYKQVKNNLEKLTEDSRDLAYKHSVKASAIVEKVYTNPGSNVYGTIYIIKGNTASPFQFFVTDSSRHFLRGSLYISEIPNYDSLQPVISFLQTDITHLIETLHWN